MPNPSLPENFETYQEAKDRRAFKIQVLRGGNQQQQQLAAKLKRCRKGNRCKSGACDVCLGLFRLWLYRQTKPILASRPHWTRASVVPSGFLFLQGELGNVDLNALRRMTNKRFERSSLRKRIVIAGIDISFNTESNRPVGWQLHLYMLVEGEHMLPLEGPLRRNSHPNRLHRPPMDPKG